MRPRGIYIQMTLEKLTPGTSIRGILPDANVTVVSVQWYGSDALELTYKSPGGKVANELLYRHDEERVELVEVGRPWSFDGDGALFRLVSEAQRMLDGDRFEGRYRDGVHSADVSDLMRRMVKENLYTFDNTPLFPPRIAYTVPYKLSAAEAELYKAVTSYVREEFNRAEALENDKRVGKVGFSLTVLQRRLASSPEAIYQSLRRRRERLESRLRELEVLQRGGQSAPLFTASGPTLDAEDLEDLEDAPENEVEEAEEAILDQATAARSMGELKIEIGTLQALESSALAVRNSGTDTKWCELSGLLNEIFTSASLVREVNLPYGGGDILPPKASPSQKLVLFTEHRDTLNYLHNRITILLGSKQAVVMIHGGIGREERLKVQESFRHDPEVRVLLATDAAGEGINLQRAHLMVNYDLPWNPNRLEQRFGRIHRIGQTETCHLWNLVAEETREGDVYRKLLEKLELARTALGGQVFDVLGKLVFEGRSLRELLIQAIREGEKPEVRDYLTTVMDKTLDREQLSSLLEDHALASDVMDSSRVHKIREYMERADARRLQPHYIESFFHEAFKRLGGTAKQRETRRYEITHVPAPVRNRIQDASLTRAGGAPDRFEANGLRGARCGPRHSPHQLRSLSGLSRSESR
jgi:superfamily II DNA/RNA helicase